MNDDDDKKELEALKILSTLTKKRKHVDSRSSSNSANDHDHAPENLNGSEEEGKQNDHNEQTSSSLAPSSSQPAIQDSSTASLTVESADTKSSTNNIKNKNRLTRSCLSCHQCKRKKLPEDLISCSNIIRPSRASSKKKAAPSSELGLPKPIPTSKTRVCRKRFCDACIERHYSKEIQTKVEQTDGTTLTVNILRERCWLCAFCRKICQCSRCRNAKTNPSSRNTLSPSSVASSSSSSCSSSLPSSHSLLKSALFGSGSSSSNLLSYSTDTRSQPQPNLYNTIPFPLPSGITAVRFPSMSQPFSSSSSGFSVSSSTAVSSSSSSLSSLSPFVNPSITYLELGRNNTYDINNLLKLPCTSFPFFRLALADTSTSNNGSTSSFPPSFFSHFPSSSPMPSFDSLAASFSLPSSFSHGSLTTSSSYISSGAAVSPSFFLSSSSASSSSSFASSSLISPFCSSSVSSSHLSAPSTSVFSSCSSECSAIGKNDPFYSSSSTHSFKMRERLFDTPPTTTSTLTARHMCISSSPLPSLIFNRQSVTRSGSSSDNDNNTSSKNSSSLLPIAATSGQQQQRPQRRLIVNTSGEASSSSSLTLTSSPSPLSSLSCSSFSSFSSSSCNPNPNPLTILPIATPPSSLVSSSASVSASVSVSSDTSTAAQRQAFSFSPSNRALRFSSSASSSSLFCPSSFLSSSPSYASQTANASSSSSSSFSSSSYSSLASSVTRIRTPNLSFSPPLTTLLPSACVHDGTHVNKNSLVRTLSLSSEEHADRTSLKRSSLSIDHGLCCGDISGTLRSEVIETDSGRLSSSSFFSSSSSFFSSSSVCTSVSSLTPSSSSSSSSSVNSTSLSKDNTNGLELSTSPLSVAPSPPPTFASVPINASDMQLLNSINQNTLLQNLSALLYNRNNNTINNENNITHMASMLSNNIDPNSITVSNSNNNSNVMDNTTANQLLSFNAFPSSFSFSTPFTLCPSVSLLPNAGGMSASSAYMLSSPAGNFVQLSLNPFGSFSHLQQHQQQIHPSFSVHPSVSYPFCLSSASPLVHLSSFSLPSVPVSSSSPSLSSSSSFPSSSFPSFSSSSSPVCVATTTLHQALNKQMAYAATRIHPLLWRPSISPPSSTTLLSVASSSSSPSSSLSSFSSSPFPYTSCSLSPSSTCVSTSSSLP